MGIAPMIQPSRDREHRRKIEASYRARHREQRRAESKAYYAKNKERFREWALIRSYGMTTEQWEALFAVQGQRCGCCGATEPGHTRGWVVDHHHETGAVRGILCQPCNLKLGKFGDTPEKVEETADQLLRYLRRL